MTAPRGPLDAAARLSKLRAMTAGEVWERVRYTAYCRWERAKHRRGGLAALGRLPQSLSAPLRRSPSWRADLLQGRRGAARFFAGAEDLEATRALFAQRLPEEREAAREHADLVLRREFSFFGATFSYPQGIDWHADPVSGAGWPRRYHRDVPVHGGDVGFGDVKHVWELGRHQFLIDLARRWALERDERCAAAIRSLVFDWRGANPVGTGVAWSCALEPAFRALSWLWAYHLTRDDPAFDDDSHLQWLEGFHDHGWFIHRHLEYYTSPYNHLAGEACALYCLGVLFPEFEEASRWRERGRRILEDRLASQFYPDGGTVEQSMFYHHATTGFYLLAALLGRQNNDHFSPGVWRALERALEFSARMRQPDGTTPRIGGADDGKPIRMQQLPLWDFRPYYAIGAVLFSRGDFKAAAGSFHEDAVWLLGSAGAARFDEISEQAPSPASRVFVASGYVVLRSGWDPGADYVLFDCGEQAAGLRRDAIPSAAHGHADCLSLIAWRHGRPVLVDPGLYCYNGPKPWQDHFRETGAHNTVKIDGRDQATHINKMAWAETYAATLEAVHVEDNGGWAIGSHDGYRHLPQGGVVHRRAIWMRPRGYLVIYDQLQGTGRHDIELTFQFAPGALTRSGDSARFDDLAELSWFAPFPLAASIHEGGERPEDGWIAPSLGVRVPAPRLLLRATTESPAAILTVLADAAGARRVRVHQPASGGPLLVQGDGWTDRLTAFGFDMGDQVEVPGVVMTAWTMRSGEFVPDGHAGPAIETTAGDRES